MSFVEGAVITAISRNHTNEKWKVHARLFGKGSLFIPDFAVTNTKSGCAL
jgi:hypothetical protein